MLSCTIGYWNLCRTRLATATAATEAATAATSAHPTGMELDCPVDPNEPTYCFCQQVSYGEMVACDNPHVSNEIPFGHSLPSLLC